MAVIRMEWIMIIHAVIHRAEAEGTQATVCHLAVPGVLQEHQEDRADHPEAIRAMGLPKPGQSVSVPLLLPEVKATDKS